MRTLPLHLPDARRVSIRHLSEGAILSLLALSLLMPLAVRAAGGVSGARGPSVTAYRSDRLELRLSAPAARDARPRYLEAERSGPIASLGVASIDRVAGSLGLVSFEPEFRGETPPAPGVNATDFTAFYVARLAPGASVESALASLRALPEVASADPIAVLPVSAIPNDSLWSVSTWFYQPSRQDIHAPEAWDLETGDTSIVVAILDTGVLPYHPDLGGRTAGSVGNFWVNAAESEGVPGVDDDGNGFVDDARGWDFVDRGSSFGVTAGEDWDKPDNDPNDFAGHGTVVAGLVGALSDNAIGVTGTAWRVKLMPVRVAWSATSSSLGLVDMSYAAQGIRYATRMKANVINCSFATLDQAGLFAAADEATRSGITIVAAAGNDGQVHELASRADVVAVGATSPDDRVPTFSNRGEFVDLSAPGDDIVSTFVQIPRVGADSVSRRQPAYSPPFDGTSMAAPMVAGAVALLQSLRVHRGEAPMSTTDVLLRLRETADDITNANPADSGYGTGRLNLRRVLADPQSSTARRTTGGPTVGPGVLVRGSATDARMIWAHGDGILRVYHGRGDFDGAGVSIAPARFVSGTSAADLGPGLGVGVFASVSDGSVVGMNGGGALLPGWPVRVSGVPAALTIPALGDLDGDGTLEVVCGAADGRVWAWRANGSRVPNFPVSLGAGITSSIALSDLDGAPGVEIVATTENGDLHAIGGDGALLPNFPVSPGIPIASPVIARLGGDSIAVVVTAGDRLQAFTPTGDPIFSRPLAAGGGVATQDLAVGDLDGDGVAEIVVALGNPARLAVYDSLGLPLAGLGWPRVLPSAITGPPVIGRLRGSSVASGHADVLVMTVDGLLAFDEGGQRLREFPKPGGAGRFPSIVDLDASGTAQVLAGSGADTLLYVYNGAIGSAPGQSPWFTPRGNFARTGSRLYAPPLSTVDDLAPSAIDDLAADSVGVNGVRLAWHAPGDDLHVGQAASYELRRATFALTESNFATGDLVSGVSAPAPTGTLEHARFAGLVENVTTWFAIRSRDDAGNTSTLSNVIAVTTGGGAPGRVLDLRAVAATESTITLAWTATGDDGATGRPERYLVFVAETPVDSVNAGAARRDSLDATRPAGEEERFTVRGLTLGRWYWFAVQAQDEVGNRSELSASVRARTRLGGVLAGIEGVALAPRARPSRVPVEIAWQGSGEVGVRQSIRIFDMTGRGVRDLALGSEGAGRVQWNGRDDRGRSVPAGIYFARLISGSFHAHTRIVLLP